MRFNCSRKTEMWHALFLSATEQFIPFTHFNKWKWAQNTSPRDICAAEEGSVPGIGAGKGVVCWVSLEKWGKMGSSGRRGWRQRPRPGHCDLEATQASPGFTFWSKAVPGQLWGPGTWSGVLRGRSRRHALGMSEKFKVSGSIPHLPNQKLCILMSPPVDSDMAWSLRISALKHREGHTRMAEKNQRLKAEHSVQRLVQKSKQGMLWI